MKTKTKTLSIKPENSVCIAMNVAETYFKGQTSIEPHIYKLSIAIAIETIKEMEKQNLTIYQGHINNPEEVECTNCGEMNTHNLDDFGFCRECLENLV